MRFLIAVHSSNLVSRFFLAERSTHEISLLSAPSTTLFPARVRDPTGETELLSNRDLSTLLTTFPGLQCRLRSTQLHSTALRVSAEVRNHLCFACRDRDGNCPTTSRDICEFSASFISHVASLIKQQHAISCRNKKKLFPWNFFAFLLSIASWLLLNRVASLLVAEEFNWTWKSENNFFQFRNHQTWTWIWLKQRKREIFFLNEIESRLNFS